MRLCGVEGRSGSGQNVLIHYSHKKPKASRTSITSINVTAETEATAIRIVEQKYPGEEVTIKSVKKK